MLKLKFTSKEHADVYSDLFLPFADIKHITHDIGIAKQDDGADLKIERLTVTMKYTVDMKVPKLGPDGNAIMGKGNKPILETKTRPDMYVIEGEEIQNVLKQLDNVPASI